MTSSVRSVFVHFPKAGAEQKQRAAKDMAKVILDSFAGPGVEPLCEALIAGAVNLSDVALFYAGDEPVGFAAAVLDIATVHGEASTIVRGMCALRPDLRGQNRILPFYLRAGLRIWWNHRHTTMWAFVPTVAPASYRLLAAHVPGIVPHPDRALSPEEETAIASLAERFHCTRAPGDHPLVCRRAMAVKAERRSPAPDRPADKLDRYFLELNPDHRDGACVMVLSRVTLPIVLRTGLSVGLTRLRRLWREVGRGWTKPVPSNREQLRAWLGVTSASRAIPTSTKD
jgi:hypothetical protein